MVASPLQRSNHSSFSKAKLNLNYREWIKSKVQGLRKFSPLTMCVFRDPRDVTCTTLRATFHYAHCRNLGLIKTSAFSFQFSAFSYFSKQTTGTPPLSHLPLHARQRLPSRPRGR